jgi:hypothetical protein
LLFIVVLRTNDKRVRDRMANAEPIEMGPGCCAPRRADRALAEAREELARLYFLGAFKL